MSKNALIRWRDVHPSSQTIQQSLSRTSLITVSGLGNWNGGGVNGACYFYFLHYCHALAGTGKKKSKDEGKPFIFQVGKGHVIRGVSLC